MTNVYALLVGIDVYPPSLPPLRGCTNDIEDVERFLLEGAAGAVSVRKLLNDQATRDDVIDGFRHHLRRAGPGDAALFWFCGHGSELPLPASWWHRESTGSVMQTLVCSDSRGDRRSCDLLDQELAVLIGEVVARGAHMVSVLDCCHSAGATRSLREMPPAATPRFADPPTHAPDLAQLLPELRGVARGEGPHGPRHVALAACQSNQLAYEHPYRLRDGEPRRHGGVFTRGLLAELRRPGEPRTYRELIAATRTFVENTVFNQTPALFPTTALADQPFLGGTVRRPKSTMNLYWQRQQWVVDAGTCHGVPTAEDDDAVRFAVLESDPVREVRLVHARPDQCIVEPVDWEPDRGRQYPMMLSRVAIPQVRVAVGGRAEDDDATAREIVQAVLTAAPGGRPSPHLRLVDWHAEAELPELVVATRPGEAAIAAPDGSWLGGSRLSPGSGVREVVDQLEHMAVWRRIRSLENPVSRLAHAVRLQIIEPRPGEQRTPVDREGLRAGESGAIELRYRRQGPAYLPPTVYLRLDNVSDREVFCVLLDLTDRFRVHANLYPGDFIAPGRSAAVAGGQLVEFALPPDRALSPEAVVQDWLMLIVSEERIQSDHFALPRLGESRTRSRSAVGLRGVVEQLALTAHHRDADISATAARDWWTSVTNVVTRVRDAQHEKDR